jgi:hypothetical protein
MYRFYTLTRVIPTPNPRNRQPGVLVFAEAPPVVEGLHDLPRQSVKLNEMETGTVNLEYGPDPANQEIRLTFQAIPEIVMKAWEDEYLDPTNVDGVYALSDHRGRVTRVKWKRFRAQLQGTLPKEDVQNWLQHYAARYALDDLDPDYGDIADLYQVTMEFFVVPEPLIYPS